MVRPEYDPPTAHTATSFQIPGQINGYRDCDRHSNVVCNTPVVHNLTNPTVGKDTQT